MTGPIGDADTRAIVDEARRRVASEHLRDAFGRTLAVLTNADNVTELLITAGLVAARIDVRVNPNGTTTEVTTAIVPTLLAVDCTRNTLTLLFEGIMGQTLQHWTSASEVLRSGLRALQIRITEPRGGQYQVELSVGEE